MTTKETRRQALADFAAGLPIYRACALARQLGDGREYVVMITTDDEDRMQDVIVPGGGRTENWERAGMPVLYSHRHDQLPVGRGTSLTPTANGIRMTFSFLDGDEFAARVENAWRQGALGASSIGFVPLKWSHRANGRGLLIEEWDLVEVSLTATPANPAAVRTLKSCGLPVADDPDEPIIRLIDEREAPEATDMMPRVVAHARQDLNDFLTSIGDEAKTPKYDPLRRAVAEITTFLDTFAARALGGGLTPDHVRSIVRQELRRRDDETVLVLRDDDDDLVSFDASALSALPQLVGASLRDGLGEVIGRELQRTFDELRGRIPDIGEGRL